ncbi:MAG TPA: putative metal-binding motif-containing protein, partial [Myxococcota bacterium]|nr:putative metal-binding motif-containing protein [Myxococcota bacterium]
DPTDFNCDGSVGYADADADGLPACEECDDSDGAIRPDATEVCNFVDDNCDTLVDNNAADAPTWYADTDGDGYGDEAVSDTTCLSPEGFVADNTDCADADLDIHPGATEICNTLDDNCDGVIDTDAVDRQTFYADADGDGYGDINSPVQSCDATENITTDTQDCDDTRGTVSPDQPEACEDGLDNNCSGEVDEDCPTDSAGDSEVAGDSQDSGKGDGGTCGCSTGEPLSTAGLILLGAVLARRRRKA